VILHLGTDGLGCLQRTELQPAGSAEAKLLGHSSPATTEVYTHVFDEDLQRKQEGLEPLALRGGREDEGWRDLLDVKTRETNTAGIAY